MPDLQNLYQRYSKYILYILAILVLGWGFTPYSTIFAGLTLGTSASFLILWFLYRHANKLSDSVTTGKPAVSLGSLPRFASAILAVMIAMKFPQYFNLLSTIVGLMTAYFVIVIDSLIMFVFKGKRQEER